LNYLIAFAAYTAAETPNVFLWAGQPLPLPTNKIVTDQINVPDTVIGPMCVCHCVSDNNFELTYSVHVWHADSF